MTDTPLLAALAVLGLLLGLVLMLAGVGISNGQKPTLVGERLYRYIARPVREREWKAHFVRLPTHVDTVAPRRGWPYYRDFAARKSYAGGMVAGADALLYADDAHRPDQKLSATRVARFASSHGS